ncbi:hypothetical protein BYT27DRAFT_7325774 [Phlegmacium glaucopus]|nr:hypothetical protein BYT27DRAFT_7325774 [Phlegmacium glaucopus]
MIRTVRLDHLAKTKSRLPIWNLNLTVTITLEAYKPGRTDRRTQPVFRNAKRNTEMTERDSFRQPSVLKVDIQLLELRNLVDWNKDCDNASVRKGEISYYKQASSSAAASKAAKKAKATKKTERKETKIALKCKSTLKGSSTTSGKKSGKKKGNDSDTDDDDLEGILEKRDNNAVVEEAHTVTEEFVEGPPSRRANATLTACPNGGHLWCIGGEFFSEDGRAYFYNDVFRYTSEKDEWRKFVSPTCLGPRSAHGVAVSLAGGGKIFLFGFSDPGVTNGIESNLEKWMLNHHPSPASKPVNAPPKTTSKVPNKQPQTQLTIKWERRKRASDAYAPSLRSGWMGILFRGVTDEDTNEETLESVFWNDLYGYRLSGKGKWSSMTLKKPKAKGGAKSKGAKKKQKDKDVKWKEQNSGGEEDDEAEDEVPPPAAAPETPKTATLDGPDPTDPLLTTPLPRYNAMLAVLPNTLYIYGGIYERGSREYTLDDLYALQLDKMDKYPCLKESDVVIPDGGVESSSDEDEDDDSDDDDDGDDEEEEERDGDDTDEEVVENAAKIMGVDQSTTKIERVQLIDEEPAELSQDELRSRATAFMGVSKDHTCSPADIQSTPLPGEMLAMFYARSREYWTQKAHGNSDNQGKQLRRDGFTLAEERYNAYKPILAEVEKILEEAGLDEEGMRRGAAGGGGSPLSAGGVVGFSLNRR